MNRGKAWLAVTVVCLTILAGCGSPAFRASQSTAQDSNKAALPHKPAHYLGVFETGSDVSYVPVQQFATSVGQRPNILLTYSSWYERFQPAFAMEATSHSAVPMIQIEPSGISLAEIAAGRYDGYLRGYALQVRDYQRPVIISFAHEMNGGWYSWGSGHVSPAIWVAAWRHVVDVFRGQSANNVTWLWAPNQEQRGMPALKDYWPGNKYVTWIGIDGYLAAPGSTFSSVFEHTITAIREFSNAPMLIAETSVSPAAGKSAEIPGIFAGIKAYHLLGLVWFDVTQSGGVTHQDWRLEDDPAAVSVFRINVKKYLHLSKNRKD